MPAFAAGRLAVSTTIDLDGLVVTGGGGETFTVDAYLGPVITDYLHAVEAGLGADGSGIHVMTSAGGLVGSEGYRSMDSLLSGPAGGVL